MAADAQNGEKIKAEGNTHDAGEGCSTPPPSIACVKGIRTKRKVHCSPDLKVRPGPSLADVFDVFLEGAAVLLSLLRFLEPEALLKPV